MSYIIFISSALITFAFWGVVVLAFLLAANRTIDFRDKLLTFLFSSGIAGAFTGLVGFLTSLISSDDVFKQGCYGIVQCASVSSLDAFQNQRWALLSLFLISVFFVIFVRKRLF